MKTEYYSQSIEDTKMVARDLVENLCIFSGKTCGKAVVILLQGNLGSGKTTFVKAVAEILGIKNHITSPTFVLEKVYELENNEHFTRMVHIDAYRLSEAKDLKYLDWGEIVDNPKNLVFLEWPEMVEGAFPENTPSLRFNVVDEITRKIEYVRRCKEFSL